MKRLDPTLDLVFKLLLTREPALLQDMLEGILARPIKEVTVLNPGILGEQSHDKAIVLDIRVRLDDGSRTVLEMQIRVELPLDSRMVYYGARDYAGQLVQGQGYELLTPTAVIVWLVEPMFPSLDRLHSIFELRERHTHTLFGDQLAIHVLQLSALSREPVSGYDAKVQRWARFLVADDAELEQLSSEDPIMALAKQTLEDLSADPEAHRLARQREDEIKLNRMDLVATRLKGQAELLLELLAVRFGPPTPVTRARIGTATAEQLVQWARRVLSARTLDEVFAP